MPRKLNLDPIAKVQARLDRDRIKYDGETTPLYEKMNKKFHTEPAEPTPKTIYLYVYGITKKGKKLIDGPFTTQKADEVLAMLDDGEIIERHTKDLARATREIKAILLERTKDPDAALERVKHALPKGER